MSTRNYVPNDHNEGEIGVKNKWWAKAHIVNINATNVETESVNATNVETESVNATNVETDTVKATNVETDTVKTTNVETTELTVNGTAIISNYIKRNTPYIVGDIAYQDELSSWVRLECVEAGTTASTIPDEYTSLQIGNYITDGTSKWIACDIRDGLSLGDITYRPILKEGYVKLNGATAQRTDYPRLVQYATDNSLWTDSPSTEPWKFGNGDGETTFTLPDYRNIFLEGGDTPSKINAGLPNITGSMSTVCPNSAFIGTTSQAGSAIYPISSVPNIGRFTRSDITGTTGINFNASWSNAIYGASATVQPPAIKLIPQIKY